MHRMTRRIVVLLIALLAALLFALPAAAQSSDAITLPIDGEAASTPGGTPDAPVIVTVPVIAGDTFYLLLSWTGQTFLRVEATTPTGISFEASGGLNARVGDTATERIGPFQAALEGDFTFAISAFDAPEPFTVAAIGVSALPGAVGSTTVFQLEAGGEQYIALDIPIDDRFDVTVQSDLDTELFIIDPELGITSAEQDGGEGLNAESTAYWVRSAGFNYLLVRNLSTTPGDIGVSLIDNPIPMLTLDGTVVTMIPNQSPTPHFRLDYVAGESYFINVETTDGTPTGHAFLQFFNAGNAGAVVRMENGAVLGYSFFPETDGTLIISLQDAMEPTNEYRVSGGMFFAG